MADMGFLCLAIVLLFLVSCDTKKEDPVPIDDTPPKILSITPSNGTTEVSLDVEIKLTFSETLDINTIKSGTLIISGGFSSNVAWGFEMVGTSATIDFPQPLEAGTEYTVQFTTAVTDLAGNPLETTFTSSFTTIPPPDTTNPFIISISPSDGETEVFPTDNIEIEFSEAIDIGTVSATSFGLRKVGNTNNESGSMSMIGGDVTFNPTNELDLNAEYEVYFTTAITDLAGNNLNENYSFNFFTLTTGCNDVEAFTNSNLGSDYPSIDAGEFTLIPDNLQNAGLAMFIEGNYQPPYSITFEYKIFDDDGVTGSNSTNSADGIVFFFQKDKNPYDNGTTIPSGNQRGFIDDGTGYGVAISPFGTRRVDYWFESPTNVINTVDTELAYTGDNWVSARIDTFSDGFDLYLNGTVVLRDFTDLDLTYSKMGFGAGSGGSDGLHMIRNIKIDGGSALCQ